MMSRKDYERAAGIIRTVGHDAGRMAIAWAFVRFFEEDNPRFDATRFRKAAGAEENVVDERHRGTRTSRNPRARNPHMERQVFQNDGWVIETDDGDFASPDFNAPDVDELRAMVGSRQRVTVGELYGRVEAVHYLPKKTWWGRLSAPGYLDATPYVYGKSRQEVEGELDNLYGEEDDDID